jgi:hypothetical protein
MKPVPRWFVAVCWVMAINFSMWTGLQFNDPDAPIWIAIYGAAAVITALLPGRQALAIVGGVIGGTAAIWGIYLAQQVWGVLKFSDLWQAMDVKGGAVEVGREAGGLIICAAWMIGASAFRFTRA